MLENKEYLNHVLHQRKWRNKIDTHWVIYIDPTLMIDFLNSQRKRLILQCLTPNLIFYRINQLTKRLWDFCIDVLYTMFMKINPGSVSSGTMPEIETYLLYT